MRIESSPRRRAPPRPAGAGSPRRAGRNTLRAITTARPEALSSDTTTGLATVMTIDPSTGAPLSEYAETSAEEIDAILDRAHDVASAWGSMPPPARAVAMGRLGAALRRKRSELARLATNEMGK